MQEKTETSIKQFETMQKSGVINSFESLKKENSQLQRIIKDMTLLVTYTSIEPMVKFIISRIIDYFVPETLVFFFFFSRSNTIHLYFFKQLQKTDTYLII